jgi:hypothetical protein
MVEIPCSGAKKCLACLHCWFCDHIPMQLSCFYLLLRPQSDVARNTATEQGGGAAAGGVAVSGAMTGMTLE